MVIDDQKEIGEVFKQSLPAMGNYEVLACSTGKEGLVQVKHFHPDIIFLDVMMPGMSGTDVAEILQDDPEVANIPIIFITGLVHNSDLEPGSQQIGGRQFLPKPFHVNQVVKIIEQTLATSKNSDSSSG